ncbi:hypothetical protein JTB14_016917 [Gonioctena quinquepunctata]|nr:hypothetical protein JTB14_016917 [Gonioctena quinquepunctata]
MTKLKVAVRVRPMSKKEIDFGSVSVIAVENEDTLEITNIKVPEQNAGDSRERVRRFTFDYCFQESCKQDQIFESVEKVISQSVKQRCHSCVLAYGQSSTGKTHTMMGIPEDPGITPKLCNRVFGYLQETAVGDEIINMKVLVSYLEIYNEKVRDLLAPEENHIKRKSSSLKIREHPKRGPYVQGLSEHPATCSSDLLDLLEKGNKKRKIAATLSNPQSSRSHSVFSVNCDGVKLNLIDLAGSEKAANRSFDISRFKEGANINKSLVALGNVISALAEQSSKQAKGIRRRFVPYRDSVLTWLLKDILGGNSNTVMVATVSPSSACYSETVNTLRFGQRAKNIISRPVVNEDPKEKTIRVLRAEIFRLKELLSVLQISPQIQMNNTINVATTNANNNHDIENAAKSKESTKEKEVIDELIITSSEKNEVIGGESKDSLDNIKELNSTEKLVPLMNVKSSVDTLRPTKLRRTYSVDHTFKMERKKSISFGSEESIPLNNARSLNSTISSGGDSLNSITGTTRRRPSLSKPTASPKSTIKRRSLESPPKKMEKAASTELSSWKKIDSKVGSIRQRPVKPRAQIVAGVTSRLYAKMKIKEASTDTNDINTYNLEAVAPKELAICENARTRLREITRKALRAHRYKNEETQTESCQIRRVKEISTDVSDPQKTDSTVDCRDSLEYHRSNKKVQFSEKSGGESQRMIKAMTSFLEQAKQLMTKMDSSSTPPENDYSVEVTVNDVKGLGGTETLEQPVVKNNNVMKNVFRRFRQSGLIRPRNTISPNNMPINRYESVLEDSCRRLEERNSWVPQRRVLHIDDFEDFSLDSHQVESSDYGSLPRRKYSRRMSSSSPSALLGNSPK